MESWPFFTALVHYPLLCVMAVPCPRERRAEPVPLTSSARSWGVSSSTFLSRESAPASHRVDEMVLRPRPAARCRGVQPLSMRASTRAPACSRNCTRPRSWVSTAKCSAVFPLVPSWRGGGRTSVQAGASQGGRQCAGTGLRMRMGKRWGCPDCTSPVHPRQLRSAAVAP